MRAPRESVREVEGSGLPRADSKAAQRVVGCMTAAMLLFLAWIALTKPYHIDDTLFARSAHALRETGDPLAFDVNWTGTGAPGALVMLNPPLMSAVVLACDEILGPSESATRAAAVLALALLAFAVARLALELGASRAWTLAFALASPAVAVSSGSIMADTLCAALLTLGVAEWCRFTRGGSAWSGTSAILALCGAALTKHAGLMALVPCAVWTLQAQPQRRFRLVWLVLPVASLAAYTIWLRRAHGPSAITQATGMSRLFGASWSGLLETLVIACGFLGSTTVAGLVFVAMARGRHLRTASICLAIATLTSLVVLSMFERDHTYTALAQPDGKIPWIVKCEFVAFVAAGTWVGTLAFMRSSSVDRRVRNLLAAWIASGLGYVLFVNWDVSLRAFLPILAPLCVIATVMTAPAPDARRDVLRVTLLTASFVVCVLLALSDREVARAARDDALRCGFDRTPGYFLGHWGFQHYAEEHGGIALDISLGPPPSGSRVLVPMWNSIGQGIPHAWVASASVSSRPVVSPLLDLGPKSGAGSYAARLGPLPFGLNRQESMDTWTIRIR